MPHDCSTSGALATGSPTERRRSQHPPTNPLTNAVLRVKIEGTLGILTLLSVPQNTDLVTKFLAYGKPNCSLHCSQKLAIEPHANQ